MAEPDQHPLISDWIVGEIAMGWGVQLMRSFDVECAQTMFPHTAPLGLYW